MDSASSAGSQIHLLYNISMKVAVGSKNPGKISAVREAFTILFPSESIEVEGIEVDSGVSAQPMSDTESIRGARNRATKAMKALDADYGVGLEGGLQNIDGLWFDCGWMIVIDADGNEGIGSTIRMEVSDKVMNHIQSGKELGDAIDIEFNAVNSKHSNGHFGLMTDDKITRITAYRDGVISAMCRFIHPEVYSQ